MKCIYNPPPNNHLAANDEFIWGSEHSLNLSPIQSNRVAQWPKVGFERASLPSNKPPQQVFFEDVADKALQREISKHVQGETTLQTLGMFKSRLRAKLLPYFHGCLITKIGYEQIAEFVNYLHQAKIRPVTIKQYLGLLKRILTLALEQELIYKIPLFPKMRAKSIPRGSFTCSEYRQILNASRRLCDPNTLAIKNHRVTAGGAYKVRDTVPVEMTWLIQFMVNSFVRPVDIKLIKHKHVESVSGINTYLRLNLPKTKGHSGQIVTLSSAKYIYDRLKCYQASRGYGNPEDFLFLPEAKDRQGAIQLITTHFRKILKSANATLGQEDQNRTLYSLRHTAITFRLLYGRGIDLLTLARNARTSVEMIERFYSSNLTAEMNIEMLQSKRTTPLLK
ncbi:phage integrase SAM-like domain-containing protein [Polynucleobacter corsicus]|uniref:phage integrase SAM-like domain-containing protein n=1 Tax=Polynucleobacter corsicus TaxID=2081042 RepID=UPI001BFEBEEC|nr:phage integrase SAM-like domain-containing protein [Polynucleobacter corsicus]QWE18797.1 site-specific integrase [Polynucleobacter corsicus]